MSTPASAVSLGAVPLGEGLVRDLGRRVREAQSQWHSPAVSAGLVRDGVLVWSAHVGSARLDPLAAPTDDTQYMIGSITKTFTALLIMGLRDAGRLSLDDRLEKYLPQTRHGAIASAHGSRDPSSPGSSSRRRHRWVGSGAPLPTWAATCPLWRIRSMRF